MPAKATPEPEVAAAAAPLEAPPAPPPAPEPRRVRQVVHEYFTLPDAAFVGRQPLKNRPNPFVSYTHLGTDYGMIGPGQEGLGWEDGTVSVEMSPDSWAGMWHSLAGLSMEKDIFLDFQACYPASILPKYQPKIVGLELRAKGKGRLKLEIKSASQETLWARTVSFDTPDMRSVVESLEEAKIGKAKYLNWVAEPGTHASVDSIAFIVQTPEIAFDEYVFLASYAKLGRCYDEHTGIVRDRAHVRSGHFDNVPATGLFALSTALAARSGMVDVNYARRVVSRIHEVISRLPRSHGLLPHFIENRLAGHYQIVPNTEYSTVDTSIYYHALLVAAEILGDLPLSGKIMADWKQISLAGLVGKGEYIQHGVQSDGRTALPAVWKDWGGETALVLAMARVAEQEVPLRMEASGRVHEGVGFIVELQSLFYPEFSAETKDAVSRQDWMAARRDMLQRQREYFPRTWPESEAAKQGFYGLSAGEARHGLGYMVSGVELPQQRILHPHYVLISASTDPDSSNVYDVLRRMEEAQLLPPWGMVEHFTLEVKEYLAMQGALNAGFETVGAYHLMARHRKVENVVYFAAQSQPDLRHAVALFYPTPPTSVVEIKTSNPLGDP